MMCLGRINSKFGYFMKDSANKISELEKSNREKDLGTIFFFRYRLERSYSRSYGHGKQNTWLIKESVRMQGFRVMEKSI